MHLLLLYMIHLSHTYYLFCSPLGLFCDQLHAITGEDNSFGLVLGYSALRKTKRAKHLGLPCLKRVGRRRKTLKPQERWSTETLLTLKHHVSEAWFKVFQCLFLYLTLRRA